MTRWRVRAGWLTLLTFAALLFLAPAREASAADPTDHARVVIVAVPDLRWIDVEAMPRLRDLAERSAVAELSVKTSSGVPRCADGSITFSAGNRANAADELVNHCAIPPAVLALLREDAEHNKFGAQVGAFGSALHAAGLTTAAVGSGAVPLLADRSGSVDLRTPDLATGIDDADVVAVLDNALYRIPTTSRIDAARGLDATIGQQLDEIPDDVTVVVAGTSDGSITRQHLHVLVISGPGWRHTALRSSSTRPPYVQLIDLAPTILDLLDVPVPASMVGSVAYNSATPADDARSYADDDDHAVSARVVGSHTRGLVTELGFLMLVLLALGRQRRWAARLTTPLARIAIGLPLCSYLVQLVPWWRWSLWGYAGCVAAGCLLLAALITLAARFGTRLTVAAGPAVIALALVADQVTGAHLQLSAPMGDNPIVAGRFHGMGNIDFALTCTSALLCAGLAAGYFRDRGRAGLGLAVAAALCLAAMAVDALPTLGDDFGGLLAMVPVVALLLALLAGIRLTPARVGLVLAGAAVLAVGVALADYARPAADQTHVGRFVGQVLHGGAGQVVRRKFGSSIGSFRNVGLSLLVAAVAIGAVLERAWLRAAIGRVSGLRAAAVAVAALAVLGTFLNDSGVVVAEHALLVALYAVAGAGLLRSPAGPVVGDDEAQPVVTGRSLS